jgi:hypothetical protein
VGIARVDGRERPYVARKPTEIDARSRQRAPLPTLQWLDSIGTRFGSALRPHPWGRVLATGSTLSTCESIQASAAFNVLVRFDERICLLGSCGGSAARRPGRQIRRTGEQAHMRRVLNDQLERHRTLRPRGAEPRAKPEGGNGSTSEALLLRATVAGPRNGSNSSPCAPEFAPFRTVDDWRIALGMLMCPASSTTPFY